MKWISVGDVDGNGEGEGGREGRRKLFRAGAGADATSPVSERGGEGGDERSEATLIRWICEACQERPRMDASHRRRKSEAEGEGEREIRD